MKLLTHNILTSGFMKNVQSGYPLKLIVDKFEEINTEFNLESLQKALDRIDYGVLKSAAQVCGKQLPENLPDSTQIEDLKTIHKALFNIEVITGTLECPETGRKFPISDGIPNMLCNEDE